jgi:hypothetical protein
MNPLDANFNELCQRHLCRHSQLGINLQHLAGVTVTYWCLYGLLHAATGSVWRLVACTVLYLAVIGMNVAARVAGATTLFVGLLLAGFMAVPTVPWWAYVVVILAAYQIQVFTHRYWDHAFDMTEFDKKYKKGWRLFILLSVYELPILLNYLLSTRILFAERAKQHAGCRDSAPV